MQINLTMQVILRITDTKQGVKNEQYRKLQFP